ncbi:hypothetical protein KIN20_016401 [Parelaphostrongylus tenuis]|uniref:Uncharacterized protein n=1 Tax=Parelaphostrongylus tenuis TaxID=148309 RepID=A0AAD5QT66_PARTN|nr:hypothetical protein KIN20_016401 [Parelaphostrongylus tenuis]
MMLRNYFHVMMLLVFIPISTALYDTLIDRNVATSSAFNVPFQVFDKRNPLYGLYKKMFRGSRKPIYLDNTFFVKRS